MTMSFDLQTWSRSLHTLSSAGISFSSLTRFCNVELQYPKHVTAHPLLKGFGWMMYELVRLGQYKSVKKICSLPVTLEGQMDGYWSLSWCLQRGHLTIYINTYTWEKGIWTIFLVIENVNSKLVENVYPRCYG